MKKIFTLILAAATCGQLFAGGIVTNTNQSAQYVRMLSRNASTQIDAVYFNPAGIVRMDDGFHLSFSNQSIFQTKTVTTTFPLLNNKEFVGDVKAPLFPSFFAVYKKDKLGISFGFGPNGGGGSATYEKGLPSFEMPVSMVPLMLVGDPTSPFSIPTNAYSADIYFDGSSIYWGSQLNFTYEINQQLSVAAGVRMINAKNVYKGHITDIMINPNMSAHPLAALMPQYTGDLVSAPQFGSDLGAAIRTAYSNTLPNIGDTLAAGTSNIEVDATQSGMAFTPIFSIQYSPNEKLDIAVKYELNTGLELTNDTRVDGSGMFPDEAKTKADIPAILAIGVGYKFSDKFRTQVSFNSYFDKQADWGGREDAVDNNLWEAAIGLEYDLSEKLTGSLGYSRGTTGVGEAYQTDISYSNSSNTIGLGIQFKPMENLAIDLGGLYVVYEDFSVDTPADATTGLPAYNTNYAKSTSMIALGVSYKF